MSTTPSTKPPRSSSGWREPMVWLVVAGPVSVILASIVTVVLTLRHPDPPLVLGTGSEQAADEAPALAARNHAATGVPGASR
ncbi:MAG: hypothetical protein QM788_17785 [Roseateles sp.]|uniref:hypothetical protein n=1 Tax=Roseateles sp. TaxID=1971397 RepID=UPI0039EBFC92